MLQHIADVLTLLRRDFATLAHSTAPSSGGGAQRLGSGQKRCAAQRLTPDPEHSERCGLVDRVRNDYDVVIREFDKFDQADRDLLDRD
jgi:hypothetical protein